MGRETVEGASKEDASPRKCSQSSGSGRRVERDGSTEARHESQATSAQGCWSAAEATGRSEACLCRQEHIARRADLRSVDLDWARSASLHSSAPIAPPTRRRSPTASISTCNRRSSCARIPATQSDGLHGKLCLQGTQLGIVVVFNHGLSALGSVRDA